MPDLATIAVCNLQTNVSFFFTITSVFENIALSILNQCYSSNVESTMQLLIMERQTFGQLSCFVIAAEGNCKHFMEHQACQEYLDRVWAHTLLVRASSTKVNTLNQVMRMFLRLLIESVEVT